MRNVLIVDGYNVIKRCWELTSKERESLLTARQELIGWLSDYLHKRPGIEIIIVFDGREDVIGTLPRTPSGISVMFANETADTRIKDIVRRDPNPRIITVVTDDREVANAVKDLGAKVKSVTELTGLIHPHKNPFVIPDKPTSSDPSGRAINDELKRYWNIR